MERPNTPTATIETEENGRRSDEELFLDYRDRGDQDAFDTLVHRYHRELFGYLRRYLRREDLAEEVFQSSFIQVHRKRDQFEEGRPFRPWLYRVATHLAVDMLRQRGRQYAVSLDRPAAAGEDLAPHPAEIASQAPGPVAQLEAAERRAWVREAVEALPEHLRSTVVLAFFQGLKYEEVAESLGVPLGTVKSRINAAMKRLTAQRDEAERAERREPGAKVRSGKTVRRSVQSTDCGYPLRAVGRSGRPLQHPGGGGKPVHPLRQALCECEGDHSDVRVPPNLADGTCAKVHEYAFQEQPRNADKHADRRPARRPK